MLIDRVVYAKDRNELVAATRRSTASCWRATMSCPMWRSATIRTLRWDRFAAPKVLPSQSLTGGFPDVWWYDAVEGREGRRRPLRG